MTFDRAWRAFADDDVNRKAPADLETRIQRACAESPTPSPQRDVFAREAIAVAASIGAVLVWTFVRSAPNVPSVALHATPTASIAPATYAATATRVPPDAVEPPVRAASVAIPRRPELPSAMLQLSPDPVAPLETVQLVRLRIPREALQALGLVLLEPETTGIVDVDVLVGEDGLPRDIRKVRVEPQ